MTAISKIFAVGLVGLTALWTMKIMTMPTLKHFTPSEFGLWWPLMSRTQLLRLDAFRAAWGAPVTISTVNGALGRHDGPAGESQHNLDMWGEVRATDIHPEGMITAADRRRAVQIARAVGFMGIGIYPNWNTQGLHVDSREGDHVATWSAFNDDNGNQQYAELERGLV